MIDRQELQRLQNEFCQATGVCAWCLDRDLKRLTEISGSEEQVRRVQEYGKFRQSAEVLERVEEGSLEDQAVEELDESGAKVAAVAVRVQGNTVIYWMVYYFPRQAETDENRFYQILDLLRDGSYTQFLNMLSCLSAEEESRRSRFAEQEMGRTLHTIEATTEIVQLLDSDGQIEAVMERWLGILAGYLQVDTAQLYQLLPGGRQMNVVCEWCGPGVISIYDKTSNLAVLEFLRISKPLIVSGDDSHSEYRQQIEEVGLQAAIIFPVLRREDGANLVLSLNHRKKRHSWGVSEVKFASDAVKILVNILTRRIQKNSLAGSYEVLESILDNVGCAIYVTDKETGEMLFANRRLQSIFAGELKEKTFDNLIAAGIEEGKRSGFFEIQHCGRDRFYDLIFKEISWVDGRDAILYSLYDITDKKLYQRKIEQQAYTDFLTGLYNRMCCERDLARQIDAAKKSGRKGALLYLDLDDFKHINDGLGHQYGDVLLKAISHALRRIPGIESTCYRMGGDEFVIVIPPDSYSYFEKILASIREVFAKPWFLKDADYYCTMSMGIVTYPDGGDTVADLIRRADIAMYEAKKGGKNRVVSYNDNLNMASGKRLDMEKNMRDAAVDGYGEFEVYYQPVIDVKGGREDCAGAEALIRWNSTRFGFIPPAEFIPLAEYLGLINPIGNFVLREACVRCKAWNDGGHPDYRVSVNLSVVQLLQPDIVETVDGILRETGLLPENLTLEVTESLAINDMERMKEILDGIKSLGVKLALDDFGTGYSSLNHIREIPFDVIKVDQSFVKELAEDAYSQSFIKMVAELAEAIGVTICVEGIETQAQYNVLKNMKIKYIQGFYFDRPMKSSEFEAKYVEGKNRDEKNGNLQDVDFQGGKLQNGSGQGDSPQGKNSKNRNAKRRSRKRRKC